MLTNLGSQPAWAPEPPAGSPWPELCIVPFLVLILVPPHSFGNFHPQQAHQPWKPASTGPRSSRLMSLATAEYVLRHWRWGSSFPLTRPP